MTLVQDIVFGNIQHLHIGKYNGRTAFQVIVQPSTSRLSLQIFTLNPCRERNSFSRFPSDISSSKMSILL